MAASRLALDTFLRTSLPGVTLYYDPPENTYMNYPCLVYSLNAIPTDVTYADNIRYLTVAGLDEYSVTYITNDPDDDNIWDLVRVCGAEFRRSACIDGLWHYYYYISYT